jgi:tRNA threonylcarbamoyladenosine biosynthesis protein TsaE
MDYISRSEDDTVALARRLAAGLKPGDVLCLHGDLGMGKSVFARGLIRAFSNKPDLEVPSPTFTLVQTYDTDAGDVWHFDLYRLKSPDEVYELGWEEGRANAIVIVEWPERLGYLMPPGRIDINLSQAADGARLLQITGETARVSDLLSDIQQADGQP